MNTAFFQISNTHGADCGDPPTITNESGSKYYGYFQNRFGEQWVFVYDHDKKIGELRGGDIGWETVVLVKGGRVDGHFLRMPVSAKRQWTVRGGPYVCVEAQCNPLRVFVPMG